MKITSNVNLGENIGNSISKYKKGLAIGIAAFALHSIFASTAKAQEIQGYVRISYRVDSISGHSAGLFHMEGASDGLDGYDFIWFWPPDPGGVMAKAAALVEGVELSHDVRPPSDPPTGSDFDLSIIPYPREVIIPEGTTHRIEISVTGYEGYNVYVNGEDMTDGGTIELGEVEPGTYPEGLSTGSVNISFELAPPEVDTLPATNIEANSAKLKGKIIEVAEDCEYRFSYWKEGGSITTTEWRGPVNAGEEFGQYIYDLDPLSTYYFRAEARNSAGATEGDVESFITPPPEPEVDTLPATDIGENSAILRGKIIDDGGEECGYRFSYWKEGGTTTTTGWSYYVETYEEFSEFIDGLVPGSTYYFRAEAENSGGSTEGDLESFVTAGTAPPELPQVDTLSATDIGENSVRLRGKIIDDGGAACEYRFSYWALRGSPQTTGWSDSISEGDTFSALISGLTPNTFYYFMAEVKNSTGESSGGKESFWTLPESSTEPSELENLLKVEHCDGSSSHTYELALIDGASEELDGHDIIYIPADLYGHPKIVSIISTGLNNNNNDNDTNVWNRVAYYDSRYHIGFINTSTNVRNALESVGYSILNADQLKTWMDERIFDRQDSVVVFCQEVLPDTIVESPSTSCTLCKYLDAGGKVVWHHPYGLNMYGHKDKSYYYLSREQSTNMFGVHQFIDPDNGELAVIIGLGRNWGLDEEWIPKLYLAEGPYLPTMEGIEILATFPDGRIASFVKHYLPNDNYRGLVVIYGARSGGMPPMDDIVNVAEYNGILETIVEESQEPEYNGFYGIVEETQELEFDARPIDTNGPVLLEVSIVSMTEQQPLPFTIENELKVTLKGFNNRNITIQQYDPNDPNKIYAAYDIQRITSYGNETGKIELYDPNDPEKTHAFFILEFDSTIAHWPLDESEGNIAEEKINNLDGIVIGNPNWQPNSGKVGGAILLGGAENYIATPFIIDPSTGPFSVYTWIKGGQSGQAIISQADPASTFINGQAWLALYRDGKLFTGLKDNQTRPPLITQNPVITSDDWYHVGIMWDGKNRHLYVNGKEVAKDNENLNQLLSSYEGLYFGTSSNLNPFDFWSGMLDNIRIYNLPVIDTKRVENNTVSERNVEDFETGDFSKFPWDPHDYNTLQWNAWIVTSDDPRSGNFCAKAVNDGKGGNSYLSVTVDCKDGEISFWRKLSSSYNWGLSFFIDGRGSDGGTRLDYWGGEKDWEKFSYPVTEGRHKFIWFYKQDQEVTEGEAAWLDDITFPLKD